MQIEALSSPKAVIDPATRTYQQNGFANQFEEIGMQARAEDKR